MEVRTPEATHDTAGSVSSLVTSQVASIDTRTGVSALTNEVVISGTRSDVSVVTGVVYQRVVPGVSSRVVLIVPSVRVTETGTGVTQARARVSETRLGVTETGARVAQAGRNTGVLLTSDAGGLTVVQVASDGVGGGAGGGKVGSRVLEGLSAGRAEGRRGGGG